MGAADPPLTIAEVLRRSAAYLSERGSPSPRLDADLLLAHALGVERLRLYTDSERPLTAARADPGPRPAGAPRPPRADGLPHRRAGLPPDEPERGTAGAGAPPRDRGAGGVGPGGRAARRRRGRLGVGQRRRGARPGRRGGGAAGDRPRALARGPGGRPRQRRAPGPGGGVAALGRVRRGRRGAASRSSPPIRPTSRRPSSRPLLRSWRSSRPRLSSRDPRAWRRSRASPPRRQGTSSPAGGC